MTELLTITRRALGALALATTALAGLPALADNPHFRIAYAPVGSFEALFLAERMGWFTEAGLDVELVTGGAPAQNIAQLMSGEIDLAATGAVPMIAAVASGAPIQVAVGNQNADEHPTVGLIVRADSPYQSIADLAGHNIGVFGVQGAGAIILFRAFRDAGLAPDSATLTNLPADTHIDNLRNGNVDATVPVGFFYELAANQSEFRVIPEPFESLIGSPNILYVSTRMALADRAEDFERLREVLDRAYVYANEHPDEVRAIDAELTRLPPPYIASRHIPPASVAINRASIESLATDMHEFGLIERAPTADEMLAPGVQTN